MPTLEDIHETCKDIKNDKSVGAAYLEDELILVTNREGDVYLAFEDFVVGE
jgi:hypothetical protein